MIADCGRGSDVGGLLRYLYGPGAANEHTNPRLLASWLGDDPAVLAGIEPGGTGVSRRDCADLAALLRFPVDTFGGPEQYVWHVPIAVAADEGTLTDEHWARVARRVLERTGVAPSADPAACRWVLVHHGASAGGNDHVHLVATLVRQDGRTEKAWNDWPRSRAAMAEMEAELGLRATPGRDRTADKASTRAESRKAVRVGAPEPARAWLRREVQAAAAMSTSRADFAERLELAGVAVRWRESTAQDGVLTGYAVGRPDDVTAAGEQVWFGGSKLAPDLALLRLEARWAEVERPAARGGGPGGVPRPRKPLTVEERAAVLVRTARALERTAKSLDAATSSLEQGGAAVSLQELSGQLQAQVVSSAEVATAVARLVEGDQGGDLTKAAGAFARAARRPGGQRVDMRARIHGLRTAAAGLALLGSVTPGERGSVLVITANLLRIADALVRLHSPNADVAAHRLRAWSRTEPPPHRPELDRARTERAARASAVAANARRPVVIPERGRRS